MIWYRSVTWWFGVAMILLTIIIMAEFQSWSIGGKLFPWMIGGGVLIVAGLHTILGVINGVKMADDDADTPKISDTAGDGNLDLRRVLTSSGGCWGCSLPCRSWAFKLPYQDSI